MLNLPAVGLASYNKSKPFKMAGESGLSQLKSTFPERAIYILLCNTKTSANSGALTAV